MKTSLIPLKSLLIEKKPHGFKNQSRRLFLVREVKVFLRKRWRGGRTQMSPPQEVSWEPRAYSLM